MVLRQVVANIGGVVLFLQLFASVRKRFMGFCMGALRFQGLRRTETRHSSKSSLGVLGAWIEAFALALALLFGLRLEAAAESVNPRHVKSGRAGVHHNTKPCMPLEPPPLKPLIMLTRCPKHYKRSQQAAKLHGWRPRSIQAPAFHSTSSTGPGPWHWPSSSTSFRRSGKSSRTLPRPSSSGKGKRWIRGSEGHRRQGFHPF